MIIEKDIQTPECLPFVIHSYLPPPLKKKILDEFQTHNKCHLGSKLEGSEVFLVIGSNSRRIIQTETPGGTHQGKKKGLVSRFPPYVLYYF
jgi:hypothetical protein